MSMHATTSVALVGVGRWGKQLLRVLDSRCRVVCCCHQGNPALHPWLKEHYPKLECTVDYDAVLRDSRIEAVVLATPIATHATMASQALDAGKHVFVEKPLATTATEARRLEALAVARQRVLFVGHVYLYHPALERIRHLTQQDPIRYAVMDWTKCGTFEDDLYWNLVSHDVSLALALFGVRPVEATVVAERGVVTACDIAVVRLRFDDMRECLIQVNRCAATRRKRLTLVTEGGHVLDWDNDTLSRFGAGQTFEMERTSMEEPLVREVEAFLQDLQASGRSSPRGSVSGSRVVEVVEQLLRTRTQHSAEVSHASR